MSPYEDIGFQEVHSVIQKRTGTKMPNHMLCPNSTQKRARAPKCPLKRKGNKMLTRMPEQAP